MRKSFVSGNLEVHGGDHKCEMGLFGVLHLCDFSRETTEEVEWGSLGSTDVGKEERELKVEREVIQETSKYLKYCEDNLAARASFPP